MFNLAVCSLFIYFTQGVIQKEQLEQVSKMTDISTKIKKKQAKKYDNPDFLWILRDFDFQVPKNDSNAYLESKINKTAFSYFQKRECAFLPNWKYANEIFKTGLKKLKCLIFDSLLRKKTLEVSLMNGAQLVEFFLCISEQLNETNLINHVDLSVTFHNTVKECLKNSKKKFEITLKTLELELPMKWDIFNDNVSKFKEECLEELPSNIKDKDNFQKEYVDDFSNFVEDKNYIFETLNVRLLEESHKKILGDLKSLVIENIKNNFYENNEEKLEKDLNEIVNGYIEKGIPSPEMDKVLNEQFFEFSEMLGSYNMNRFKIYEEKNGEICILECLKSFSKELMKHFKDFPLPEDKFNNIVSELKISEIGKLEGRVTNKEVLLKLKEKLVDLLDKEIEDIRKYNFTPSQNSNKDFDYHIFLSYCRKGMKEEVKLFREKLEKEKFKVWHDDKCLPNLIGEDYKRELINGINCSRVFLFIWNKNYSKSDNCMKEFKWAISKNKKTICIELEKLDCDLIQFDLKDNFTLKLYHVNVDCKLSEIPSKVFSQLLESIN